MAKTSGRASAPHEEHLNTEDLGHDLKGRSIIGGAAIAVAQAAKFVLTLGSALIMARLLVPGDFGLVAMVSSIIGLFSVFKDAGLSTATIQRDKITHAQVSNLFWINLALSGLFAMLIAALAPLLAWFYEEARLTSLALVLSSTFVLNGAAVQHMALLNRQMRFKAIAVVEIASLIVSIVVGIVLAILGAGYWALAGAAVSLEAAALLLTWAVSGWRPGRPVRRSGTWPLLGFGANLTAANSFLTMVASLDIILIGKLHGSNAVGLYSRANSLLMRPINQFAVPISGLLLPALSRLQLQPERYRRSFMQFYEVMALVSFPLAALSLALARPATLVLLGQKWEEAAALLQAFSCGLLYLPFAIASRLLLTTQGRGRDTLVANAIAASVTALSIVAGLPFGPLGVAIAVSVSGCVIRMPILFHLSGKSGPVSSADLWVGFLRHLPLWAIVLVVTSVARLAISNASHLLQLLVCLPLGLLTAIVFIACSATHRRVAVYLIDAAASLDLSLKRTRRSTE